MVIDHNIKINLQLYDKHKFIQDFWNLIYEYYVFFFYQNYKKKMC